MLCRSSVSECSAEKPLRYQVVKRLRITSKHHRRLHVRHKSTQHASCWLVIGRTGLWPLRTNAAPTSCVCDLTRLVCSHVAHLIVFPAISQHASAVSGPEGLVFCCCCCWLRPSGVGAPATSRPTERVHVDDSRVCENSANQPRPATELQRRTEWDK